MEVGGRISLIIEELSLTKKKFAEMLSISPGNLSDWINPKRKSNPTVDSLKRIYELFNVNLAWLLTGNGNMFLESNTKIDYMMQFKDKNIQNLQNKVDKIEENSGLNGSYLYDHLLSETVNIPIGGEIAAGEPAESFYMDDFDYAPVPKKLFNDIISNYCVLLVNGHSMQPQINHRDLAIIHYLYDWQSLNSKVVAVRIDGEITLKHLQIHEQHELMILKPFNSGYEDIIIDKDNIQDIKLVGQMVWLLRAF